MVSTASFHASAVSAADFNFLPNENFRLARPIFAASEINRGHTTNAASGSRAAPIRCRDSQEISEPPAVSTRPISRPVRISMRPWP